ncbi:hypothetical protein FKM82_022264 [Ascaphus truei]
MMKILVVFHLSTITIIDQQPFNLPAGPHCEAKHRGSLSWWLRCTHLPNRIKVNSLTGVVFPLAVHNSRKASIFHLRKCSKFIFQKSLKSRLCGFQDP